MYLIALIVGIVLALLGSKFAKRALSEQWSLSPTRGGQGGNRIVLGNKGDATSDLDVNLATVKVYGSTADLAKIARALGIAIAIMGFLGLYHLGL